MSGVIIDIGIVIGGVGGGIGGVAIPALLEVVVVRGATEMLEIFIEGDCMDRSTTGSGNCKSRSNRVATEAGDSETIGSGRQQTRHHCCVEISIVGVYLPVGIAFFPIFHTPVRLI